MSYYVYDIDGTLADTSERVQFVRPPEDWPADKKFKKDWKNFFNKQYMLNDKPIMAVINIAQLMIQSEGVRPIYCTGRPSDLRQVTVEWLQHNVEPDMDYQSISDRLFMRSFDDHRDDTEVKLELFLQIVAKYGDPYAMFEDRDRVVKSIRDQGYRVFQVTDGNF